MERLDRSGSTDTNSFVPKEGQRPLLSSNKVGSRCPSLDSTTPLSTETREALEELGEVLLSIHRRMIAEGYELVDGHIVKMQSQKPYEENNQQQRAGSD